MHFTSVNPPPNPTNQTGVALVQVLLIVTMLLVLVVQLSKQSHEQVEVAIALDEKLQADLKLDSALEKAAYSVSTEKHRLAGGRASAWNFYGKPFTFENTQLEIQDLSGLISVPYFYDMLPLLGTNGSTIDKRMLDNVKRWQGEEVSSSQASLGRGASIQYLKELYSIPGWNDGVVDESGLTAFPVKVFNAALAPDIVLRGLVNNSASEQAIEARKEGKLTRSGFLRFSRYRDLDFSFSASENVEIRSSTTIGDWTYSKSRIIQFDAEAFEPIVLIGNEF